MGEAACRSTVMVMPILCEVEHIKGRLPLYTLRFHLPLCWLLQRLAECHAQEVAGMEQAMHAARQELERQAELQVQAATEAAEQRAKAELAER